ncbi:MAG: 50S ribosomal protein L11 methyltransferase [Zetaproteobacteria bacterium CG06_land_8_20_14_3_00_59_53]|nr:MAG: ribosomal protein L11 methyltransferase [Zetaproteobacteria bacterium CG2_30_59_37]PIO89618.1 MAG: 50S ribosomal protein L11 methyltransferase [Zetaproteobacteria bacterium CG23_combo_of_CG06-09_8_20_14_all_59_86]PIQ65849.1 MAG: 50S ribosomal protein L11 methyltransferase [Zetaproteobacteria bacterium CG11_big_fil_rev_8_21_14_0_20_59_439]PIU71002.1 MAG: 50S ribosomal protein L11 methyltransferase [Zetaproteobacteria bacterium CG06_land_8_20_14_3_00_59_53]PIU97155.1 MAG: 50S ribosomal pr
MQETISPGDSLLELRLPENAVSEDDFVQMCAHLEAGGSALETDAKTGAGEHVAWFPAGEDVQHSRAVISAAALLLGVAESDIRLTLLNDDWETAWQRDWHGMPIGDSLWVRPSFCEEAPLDRIDIVLDPGMAFGTGQHATTKLCLETIERMCREAPPQSMLDMGAGSGLLAIAAGKLGAQGIVAIDNDPVCVEACSVNAAINGIKLESLLGEVPPVQRFELVAANILAGPLIDMAPALTQCVGNRLVLSGLLATQIDAVSAAYIAAGLRLDRSDTMDEWAALEMLR